MDDVFYAGALILAAVSMPAAAPQAPAPELEGDEAIMLDASVYSGEAVEALGQDALGATMLG